MKTTSILASLAVAALLTASTAFADHDKNCKGTHGTVSAISDDSITVDGKTYTLDSSATVTKEDGTTLGASGVKVGDKVCLDSAGESRQVSKLMVLSDTHAMTEPGTGSKVRSYVREKVDAAREKVGEKVDSAREKLSATQQKTHDQMCQGHHGTITDKTANTITVDGKTYALAINTPVNKQEEPLLPKTTKVGDRVCYQTKAAADGSQQITQLMAIDNDADMKVKVREKDSDTNLKVEETPSKVEVETPNKTIEVK